MTDDKRTLPDDKTVVTPEKTEVTPENTVVATEKTETKPDLTGIKTELETSVTEKVSKTLLEKIGGALGLNKEEKKQLPTDPEELAQFIRENAKRGTEEVFTEKEKEEQAEREERESQVSEGAQRFQTLWKNQYAELAESGRVPKIENPDDKNDPGNVAKVKILTKLSQIIKENEEKGIDYVPTLKEVFYENPNILRTDTVAGATTPISGGGRTTAQTGALKYDVLHKTDIEDLVKSRYS